MSTPITTEERKSELLTAAELAARLGCHRNTIYNLVRRGDLPCIRVGATYRFSLSAVEWALSLSPDTTKEGA